jgi:putative transposase
LKPAREHATNNAQTYFATAKTWESRALFRAEPWARLFFQNLLSHRKSYLLHQFVLMPDHFHLLITPSIALERAVQFIKGGFSFRAKREIGSSAEIWQRGFSDHRIRDAEDYEKHLHYIHLNPVKKHLSADSIEYRYSSAFPGWKLDSIPQGLKPGAVVEMGCGTAEAVPFQNQVAVRNVTRHEGATALTQSGALKGHDLSRAEQRPADLIGHVSVSAGQGPAALKGHDFSRAGEKVREVGALAPEGGER